MNMQNWFEAGRQAALNGHLCDPRTAPNEAAKEAFRQGYQSVGIVCIGCGG